MRESVIYQDILQQGRQEGKQEGKQEEAVSLVLRQLTRRVGEIEPTLQEQIQKLPVEKLEDLAEALLDFTQSADLVAWLEQQQASTDEPSGTL